MQAMPKAPKLAGTASSPKKTESPPTMPNSKALASLRAAILEERMNPQDAQQVLDRYKDFTAKLTEFQTREGPSPTRQEFEAWRSDIFLVRAVREKQLKAECANASTDLAADSGSG